MFSTQCALSMWYLFNHNVDCEHQQLLKVRRTLHFHQNNLNWNLRSPKETQAGLSIISWDQHDGKNFENITLSSNLFSLFIKIDKYCFETCNLESIYRLDSFVCSSVWVSYQEVSLSMNVSCLSCISISISNDSVPSCRMLI